MYCDSNVGPIIADVKQKSDQEQLQQVRNYVVQKKPDYESAIGILQQLLAAQPLHMEALIFLA